MRGQRRRYISGLAGNTVLDRLVKVEAGDIRTRPCRGEACCSVRLCGNALRREILGQGVEAWVALEAGPVRALSIEIDDELARGFVVDLHEQGHNQLLNRAAV